MIFYYFELVILFLINFSVGYWLGTKKNTVKMIEMEFMPFRTTHKAQIVDLQDPLDSVEI
jgi:hypothetical protein